MPWFTNSLKALMNERCRAFHEGNLVKKLELQKEIKIEVRKAKLNYKINLEKELSMNNLGSVWKGMTLITGTKGCEIKKVQLPGYDLAEDLNKFYLRFDVHEFGPVIESMKSKTSYGCSYNFFLMKCLC